MKLGFEVARPLEMLLQEKASEGDHNRFITFPEKCVSLQFTFLVTVAITVLD